MCYQREPTRYGRLVQLTRTVVVIKTNKSVASPSPIIVTSFFLQCHSQYRREPISHNHNLGKMTFFHAPHEGWPRRHRPLRTSFSKHYPLQLLRPLYSTCEGGVLIYHLFGAFKNRNESGALCVYYWRNVFLDVEEGKLYFVFHLQLKAFCENL